MKVGIDIHGVITEYPAFFSKLSELLMANGHEVYIITGRSWIEVSQEVKDANVQYTKQFSIVDYHQQIGTPMTCKNGSWWMDSRLWNSTKGDFCAREGIDVHFDNDEEYFEYFPHKCLLIPVNKRFTEMTKFVYELIRMKTNE